MKGGFPGGTVGKNPPANAGVQALVREDPTCRGATKPVCHNYWAYTLEPASHNYWAHVPQLLKPARLESVLRSKRSPRSLQLEKARVQQQRPNAAKNKINKIDKFKKKKRERENERETTKMELA